MIVQFGEYAPDIPAQENQGLTVASNCIPFASHYEAIQGLSAFSSNGLSGVCKGFAAARDGAGSAFVYTGDASALYGLSGNTFADYTRASGGAYNTAAEESWEFAQWGDKVIATNYSDDPQEITLGSTNFIALAGSPPKAKHIGVVRDFVVLGNCIDGGTGNPVPNRVYWSAFNNSHLWNVSAATQCDSQDLAGDGGWVMRVIGGEYGTVFQERSIWRMTYVGSPVIFQFDKLEENRGTPAPNSVIKVGSVIFFLGQDDFYMISGGPAAPIGANRIYKTFSDDYDSAYWYNVQASADPIRTLVFWAYPGAGNVGGRPNKMIVFNWTANRWAGPIDITGIDFLVTMQTTGYTLEQLDAISTNLDTLPASLDSRLWMGGSLQFGAMDSSHKLSTFTGNYLTATFETGERQIKPGGRALVVNTEPLVEGSSASSSVAVAGRDTTKATVSFDAAVAANSYGEAPVMNEAKYHRFRVSVADGFDKAYGIKVMVEPGGEY